MTTQLKNDYRPIQIGMMLTIAQPSLFVGKAENMIEIESESVDVIITSPPYNLGESNWKMGGNGRTHRGGTVGYDNHNDTVPEADYQEWQIQCLIEMYRVSKSGASLFYNHKIRTKNHIAIHPMAWLARPENPWRFRQRIVWNRGSTHNHNPDYFWPEDEEIYWMVKGKKPARYGGSIGQSTVWDIPPAAPSWHPAPFPAELVRRLLNAIGGDNLTVLDPFAGSCTTLKVALDLGHNAIGVDVSENYLQRASIENGWIPTTPKTK